MRLSDQGAKCADEVSPERSLGTGSGHEERRILRRVGLARIAFGLLVVGTMI